MIRAILCSNVSRRVVQFALSLVFVYAAVSKMANLQSFADLIADFGIVWDPLVFPVAVGLSTIELLAGIGLLLNVRYMLGLVSLLLGLFLVVLVYGLWLGLDVECGCFGFGDPGASGGGLQGVLYRDVALLGCCAFLYACCRCQESSLRPS